MFPAYSITAHNCWCRCVLHWCSEFGMHGVKNPAVYYTNSAWVYTTNLWGLMLTATWHWCTQWHQSYNVGMTDAFSYPVLPPSSPPPTHTHLHATSGIHSKLWGAWIHTVRVHFGNNNWGMYVWRTCTLLACSQLLHISQNSIVHVYMYKYIPLVKKQWVVVRWLISDTMLHSLHRTSEPLV